MTALSVLNDWRLERGLNALDPAQLPSVDLTEKGPDQTLVLSVWKEWWETEEDARNMLQWLSSRDKKLTVLGTCACARTSLRFLPEGEERPRIAIETAERWVKGKATKQEVKDAANLAYAAANKAAASNYGAAYAAAYAVANAAGYAAKYGVDLAADAAAAAAYAAAYVSTNSAYLAGKTRASNPKTHRPFIDHLRILANLVRETIPWAKIEETVT